MFKQVESAGKLGYYEALREAGYAPAQAKFFVERAMFDYGKASPASKQFFRRIVPFWGWISNNVPLQVSRLLKSPAGSITGMTTHAMAMASGASANEYVPSFLREGLGVRLKGDDESRTTFIKQTGLPIEDLNRLVMSHGLPDFKRSFQKNFASLTPGIVAPVESFLTGKQSFSGRPLNELEGHTPFPWLNSAIHYSPGSSIFEDYAGMADPRKTTPQKLANFLTGLKFGTYDARKLRLREVRDAMLKEALNSPYAHERSDAVLNRDYKGTPEAAPLAALLKRLRQIDTLRARLAKQDEMSRT